MILCQIVSDDFIKLEEILHVLRKKPGQLLVFTLHHQSYRFHLLIHLELHARYLPVSHPQKQV